MHLDWLAKVHALVRQRDHFAAISLQSASDFLTLATMPDSNVAQILNTLHRAIAGLELEVGQLTGSAFGPGAVYDFMRALRDLLQSATKDVLVVDPYMNADVFDVYVSAVSTSASVRLLLKNRESSFLPALATYSAQHPGAVEARASQRIHDRVVLIDHRSCWVLGQSIKDAAKKTPTYLAPLSDDVSILKREDYNAVWESAERLH